jgi:frataxin-like iron-binding protein CyaY
MNEETNLYHNNNDKQDQNIVKDIDNQPKEEQIDLQQDDIVMFESFEDIYRSFSTPFDLPAFGFFEE